jgi:polar amino acid transport system permease protein
MHAWEIVWSQRDVLASGFGNTLQLFILSTLIAFSTGVLALWALEGPANPLRSALRILVDGMRMMPFLIYAYLLYYGLPEVGVRLDAWTAGLIALATYHAAYFAEILRGARAVLSRGQFEAARAHGYTTGLMVRRILLPQLVLRSGPLLGNQLIICLKDSAFLTIITVKELTGSASAVQSTFFIPVQAFVVAIGLYWLVSLLIESLVSSLGRLAQTRGLGYEQATTRR